MAERKKHYLIKNVHEPVLEPHFSWNTFNCLGILVNHRGNLNDNNSVVRRKV